SIIAHTCRATWGRIASTWASGTGWTGALSRAAERPLASARTAVNAWWTDGGGGSFSTAHLETRTIRPTRLLISLRHRSASTIACRTAFRASGPKSLAAVGP